VRGKVRQRDYGLEDLQTALSAVASANFTIQQADAKVGILVVMQVGMAAVVSTEAAALFTASGRASTPVHVATTITTMAFICGFFMSGRNLVQAIRPRLDRAQTPSRFGVATLVDMDPAAMVGTPLSAQCVEAWALARTLAGIAMRKHGYVARAIPWFGLMLVTVASWAAIFVLIRS
jgi:hypothetical protein